MKNNSVKIHTVVYMYFSQGMLSDPYGMPEVQLEQS
jgi:hypothetical protein